MPAALENGHPSRFRRFFLRGLGIVLPSILTLWILVAAYGFVQGRIAEPINAGVRLGVLMFTPFPLVDDNAVQDVRDNLQGDDVSAWRRAGQTDVWLRYRARETALRQIWSRYHLALDQIGLVVAILLIYGAGAFLSSLFGHRIFQAIERWFVRLPVIKQLYPAVKQVTDFLVGGGEAKFTFSRVVAVEFPRRGCWVVALVTGETMRAMHDHAGEPMVTVFVPNTPTPFTGFAIMVPRKDTVDLPMTIDEALKFVVSAGVIIPESQKPVQPESTRAAAEAATAMPVERV